MRVEQPLGTQTSVTRSLGTSESLQYVLPTTTILNSSSLK